MINRAAVILAVLILHGAGGQTLFASGSCCVLALSDRHQPTVAVIGSLAWSHEHLGRRMYDFSQRALILKGTYPLSEALFLTVQTGIPLSTSLSSSSGVQEGRGGFLYGLGIGAALRVIRSLDVVMAASYARSHGNVESLGSNQTFIISEVQATIVGEVRLLPELATYGGGRIYVGRNRLRHDATGVVAEGDREGNFSPLFGLRVNPWESIGLIAEGSLGHTRVASVTAAFHL